MNCVSMLSCVYNFQLIVTDFSLYNKCTAWSSITSVLTHWYSGKTPCLIFHRTALSSIDDATASPHSDALLMKNYPVEFYQISMCQYTRSILRVNGGYVNDVSQSVLMLYGLFEMVIEADAIGVCFYFCCEITYRKLI